jgi:hypothetical protein
VAATVDGYTLEEAQAGLAAWKAAVAGLATSQSYTIGQRTLTRVELSEAREMVGYFAGIVDQLTPGSSTSPGVRVMRAVYRDT